MRDGQDPKAQKGPLNSRFRRPSRPSFSSVRSLHSVRSQVSQKSHKSRNRFRPRGLSLSSSHSQAVSDGSSIHSARHSRRTSHADDSDASDTNESLGETEEDVWFPNANEETGDINVDELDQLLNLSDEEVSPFDRRMPPPAMSLPETHSQEQFDDDDEADADAEADNREDTAAVMLEAATGASADPHPRSPQILPSSVLLSSSSPLRPNEHHRELQNRDQHLLPLRYASLIDVELQDSEDSPHSTPPDLRSPTMPQAGSNQNSNSESKAESDNSGDTVVSNLENLENVRKHIVNNPQSQNGHGEIPIAEQQSQRYSFYAAGLENTIHAADLASLVGESDSFSSLFNPKNGVWFLDCFRPTDIEMRALSRAFGIHPLTTEDIQQGEAREKFEMFKKYYLVVYHTFENDQDDPNYMEPINFYMLVFNEGVISFHFEPVSHCRNVRRRMRQLKDYVAFSPDWIAYALIDDITDSFAPQIMTVEKEADLVEDAVYVDNGAMEISTLLSRLGEGRRRTMQLMRMLTGKADVVKGFAKRCTEAHNMPGAEMALYLGDIQDHIVTMYQNLSAYEKIFSRTHFNYMGLLQMEFVNSSNRMTGVLGKVTVLGTVLVPMNLITGMFGMNVKVPGQDGSNLGWFFGILGVILVLILTLLIGGTLYLRRTIDHHLVTNIS